MSRGFTLIELLVVIGVLGILAAGLLATIDPLEQFRKGADSNRKTASLEFVNAVTRYYASRGQMPWAGGVTGCTAPSAGALSTLGACMTALIDEGELKDTYDDQTTPLSKLYVTGTTASIVVCYDPESKSESLRAETLYSQTGTTQAGCPAAGTVCYWCAR